MADLMPLAVHSSVLPDSLAQGGGNSIKAHKATLMSQKAVCSLLNYTHAQMTLAAHYRIAVQAHVHHACPCRTMKIHLMQQQQHGICAHQGTPEPAEW